MKTPIESKRFISNKRKRVLQKRGIRVMWDKEEWGWYWYWMMPINKEKLLSLPIDRLLP